MENIVRVPSAQDPATEADHRVAQAVPADIAGLLAVEEAIIEAYGLYRSQLPPGKELTHYVEFYRKDFLDPELDRFDSIQRMGMNKLSKPDAPAVGTPEYSALLVEHRLMDPVPSKRCLMDYLESYREHGEKGKLYRRLSPLQQEWIRAFVALRRDYAEARRQDVAGSAEGILRSHAA